MKIVTTPMCEEILKWNNITEYTINKFPDEEEDIKIAILLSESKTKHPSIRLKLNTFQQIKESILKVHKNIDTEITSQDIDLIFKKYPKAIEIIENLETYKKTNSKINIKVYSEFLKDIVADLGFNIVDDKANFVVYPDYMNIPKEDVKLIKISSHNNVSNNPIERAITRYLTIINKTQK